jgi:pyruvate/2-oxoglutarate dehydrogenase complex dihydrolipoamide dehydrogenase (E3) component
MSIARDFADSTVNKVRLREDPASIVARNTNLDIALITTGHFISPNEMILEVQKFYTKGGREISDDNIFEPTLTRIRVRGEKFLIATGASPIVPKRLEMQAQKAGIPFYTYRTLLRQDHSENHDSIWELLDDAKIDSSDSTSTRPTKRLVVAGGGATSCELGQTLARLGKMGRSRLEIHFVAPELLAGEEVSLQNAAYQILSAQCGIQLYLGLRIESISENGSIHLSNGSVIQQVDALLLCLGRQPSLESLHLDNANVEWNHTHGVIVHSTTLQSVSAPHIFACGDCASAVASKPATRTATHAAWTGYHAVVNAITPRFLTWGSKSVHPHVPRVIYTDPELGYVGLSLQECIHRYGLDGFDRLYVGEEGTDRSDMEALERETSNNFCFVEIRATKLDGRVLGFTVCGSTASELTNEMSVVVENGLTVRQIAKALHSYPSHGYLLHRAALSLALSNIWGLLEACGPVGATLACPGRFASNFVRFLKRRLFVLPSNKWYLRRFREWQSLGANRGILISKNHTNDGQKQQEEKLEIVSFLDLYENEEWRNSVLLDDGSNAGLQQRTIRTASDMNLKDFKEWVEQRPSRLKK